MCQFFASQSPESYSFEMRSIRLNGQSTSIRLEKIFWPILEEIAKQEGMSLARFVGVLREEVFKIWGETANFTSHLRCVCIVALERGVDSRPIHLGVTKPIFFGSRNRITP